MKLGLGSYAYFWSGGVPGWPQPARPMGALGLVERAAELGLKLVQIADNMPLDALAEDERAALRERARELGVEIEVGARGIADGNLERQIELCRYFGARMLRVVVDTVSHHPSADEVVSIVRGVAPELKRAGITLGIENHDRFDARTFGRIVREVGSDAVGICLDTVNSFGALQGPEVVVDTLAPMVVNLHLKDFSMRRASHMMGFVIEGAVACEGRLDVPWLLGRLKDVNAILELWPPPEERIEDTVAKEDEWVVRSVRNLREFIPD